VAYTENAKKMTVKRAAPGCSFLLFIIKLIFLSKKIVIFATINLNKMKIALIGYGKMGKTIERIALERGHEIVSIIDVHNHDEIKGEAFASADVAIEFTAPHVAYDNCVEAMSAGVKVVSGSTGWYQQHEAEMREKCEKEGKTLFWSSNFSLGVAIFSAVNKYLARIMNRFDNYKVHIEETHHIHKLDAPSGTAITLAEGILENIGHKSGWIMGDLTNPDGTVTKGAVPKPTEIKIDAIRRDEVPGIHTITYGSDEDTITITHDAHNRNGFALGAVIAAEYTAGHSGLLGMKDLLDF
jgi:4-hydroxy-tetrahydrodipicolinate reductase